MGSDVVLPLEVAPRLLVQLARDRAVGTSEVVLRLAVACYEGRVHTSRRSVVVAMSPFRGGQPGRRARGRARGRSSAARSP